MVGSGARIDPDDGDGLERLAVRAGKGDGIAGFQMHLERAITRQQVADQDVAGSRVIGIQVATVDNR